MDHNNISYYKAFFYTPSLWSGELDGLLQFVFPKISFDNLEMGTIPSQVRFGHKIEHIFLMLIQHSRQYQVIAHNIPITKEKVSLGEIDFILQDIDNQKYVHIELTYKFYVIYGNAKPIGRQLLGPNLRDSLHAKKERIKNHQIPLLKTSEATSVLEHFNIKTSELVHQVCFKSQLFIPFTGPNLDLAPFNSNCISGRWIPFQEFRSRYFFGHRYYLPSKLEWLLDPHNGVDWVSHNDILDMISSGLENKNSPLIWMKLSDISMEKLFIVWW